MRVPIPQFDPSPPHRLLTLTHPASDGTATVDTLDEHRAVVDTEVIVWDPPRTVAQVIAGASADEVIAAFDVVQALRNDRETLVAAEVSPESEVHTVTAVLINLADAATPTTPLEDP